MSQRIAIVAASLDIVGGQGVQARVLAEHLMDEGFVVDFVPVNPRFPAPLAWVRRIKGLRTVLNELIYVWTLARLRHANVVHVFSASYWSFVLGPVPAIAAARCLRKRVILNYHSGEAHDHLTHWGVLVHPWLRLVDEIVVPSPYLHEVFARHGYRARMIANVVDTSRMRYRERAAVGPRLLSTRNLEPHYGVDVILRAFAVLKNRFPAATLTVAGYGSEEQPLRQLATSLGVDGIRFVGRQEPNEMAALYEAADIFVNTSVVDNQPLSVLEAFAYGLPVMSTPTGDIKNMVGDGERGRLIPANDPEALASAVTGLIENPAIALRMAQNARAHVETHTWPRVRGAWTATYRRDGAATVGDNKESVCV
jgi:glycosyltransferase involved in cell wall biosynthesis